MDLTQMMASFSAIRTWKQLNRHQKMKADIIGWTQFIVDAMLLRGIGGFFGDELRLTHILLWWIIFIEYHWILLAPCNDGAYMGMCHVKHLSSCDKIAVDVSFWRHLSQQCFNFLRCFHQSGSFNHFWSAKDFFNWRHLSIYRLGLILALYKVELWQRAAAVVVREEWRSREERN